MLRAIASQPQDYYHTPPAAADLPREYKSIAEDVIAQPIGATDVVIEHTYKPLWRWWLTRSGPAGTLSSGKITWTLPRCLTRPRYAVLRSAANELRQVQHLPGRRYRIQALRCRSPPAFGAAGAAHCGFATTHVDTHEHAAADKHARAHPHATADAGPAPADAWGLHTCDWHVPWHRLPAEPVVISDRLAHPTIFIILWTLRFIREMQTQPDPKVPGSGPNPCPLWLWWFLPILLLLLGMVLSPRHSLSPRSVRLLLAHR